LDAPRKAKSVFLWEGEPEERRGSLGLPSWPSGYGSGFLAAGASRFFAPTKTRATCLVKHCIMPKRVFTANERIPALLQGASKKFWPDTGRQVLHSVSDFSAELRADQF